MSSTQLLIQRDRRHSIDGFTSPRSELLTASETDSGRERDVSPLRSPSDTIYPPRPASVNNTPTTKRRRLSWSTVKSHLNRSGPIQIPNSWKNSSSDSISKRSSSFKVSSQTDTQSGAESVSEEEMESIDTLLAKLVSETQEKGFVDNFLWTSGYFIEPIALLERLIDLYHRPAGDIDVASEMVTRFRLVNTIKKMIDMQCHTSNEASVTWNNRLLAFVDELNKGSESDQSCATHLKQKLDEIKGVSKPADNGEIQKSPSLVGESNPGKADAVAYVTREKFNIMEDRAIDIAEQLTLRDYEMFQAIPIEVFQKKRFEKEMEDLTSPLGLFIAKFNEISLWIATQIISASSSNGNKELIARFIEIMRELRKLNNFNAVMAFFSALNLGSVSGFVTRCFADLPDDLAQFFNQTKKLMDHSMNFKSYRETLEMAEPPCIPYLGLIMRDLMHLEELPSTEDNMINWHKLSRVGKTLSQVAKFHKSSYQFAAIPHIQKFLRNIPKYSVILSENQLYTLSRAIINEEADASEALSKIDAPKLIPTTSDTNLHEAHSDNDMLPDRNALFCVPPWVIKREVRDEDGNRTTFEEVIGEHTVICVFMRQFANPPKSASSLSQIKPFLNELGVKLIAIGSGNTNSAAGFKIQAGFEGELFFDEALHLIDDFKVKRGWNKAQNRRNLNRSKLASIFGCDENEGLGDINQLSGTFLLRGDKILFEHLEQFAGDNVDPIQILRKAGANQDMIDRVGLDTPKFNAGLSENSKTEKKIQKLEEKLTRLRSKSSSAPDSVKQQGNDIMGMATIKKAIGNLKASFGKAKSGSPEMKRIRDQHKEAMIQIKLEYYRKKLEAEHHNY